jgi:hypothetical protein
VNTNINNLKKLVLFLHDIMFQVFDFTLSDEEMKDIDALDMKGKGQIFDFLFFKG